MHLRRLLLIALCAFGLAYGLHVIAREHKRSQPISTTTVKAGGKVPAVWRALRPNYPYSVISGGAYSAAELANASTKDRVVAAHFADFDMKSVRTVTLAEDRYQYVSYRVNNQILWTNDRLRIPKGEVLLTDGRSYARTRCGNRLSNTPKGPTSAQQPPDRALSLPPFRPELLKKGEIQLPPAPVVGEITLPMPLLPFEMPAVPLFAPTAGTEAVASAWPQVENYPPAMGVVGGAPFGGYPIAGYPGGYPGLGSSPGTPGTTESGPAPPLTPETPLTPGAPGTPTISTPLGPPIPVPVGELPVPEPTSLYLLGLTLIVGVWILTRVVRNQRSLQKNTGNNEN